MPVLVAIIALFVAVALYAINLFNRLIRLRNNTKNAFSQIDVQLKRRHDLIPNLVETAKGYMKHEASTLQAVIQARNTAAQVSAKVAGRPDQLQELAGAESLVTQSLSRFMAVAESYPDLKANQTMSQLMEELTSTENKISYARQAYNDAAMALNNQREIFPASLIAGPGGFTEAELWHITDRSDTEVVKVALSS